MECLLPYFNMVTVPHEMVGLEKMSDYRGFTVPRSWNQTILLIYVYIRRGERENSQSGSTILYTCTSTCISVQTYTVTVMYLHIIYYLKGNWSSRNR